MKLRSAFAAAATIAKLAGLGGKIRMAREQGLTMQALSLAEQARELALKQWDPAHNAVIEVTSVLAQIHMEIGNVDAAEPLFQEVCEAIRTLRGEASAEFADALGYIAGIHLRKGELAQAEETFLRAGRILRLANGAKDPRYAGTLAALGQVYREWGRFDQADASLAESVDVLAHAPAAFTRHYAGALNQLAELLCARGDFRGAEETFFRAAEVLVKHLGGTHPDLGQPLVGAARNYVLMGKFEEADKLLDRAYDIQVTAFGPDSPRLCEVLHALAARQAATAQFAEAERTLLRVNKLVMDAYGEDHPNIASTLGPLAELYMNEGRDDEALELHRRACRIEALATGVGSYRHAAALHNLARDLQRVGDFAGAAAYMEEVIVFAERTLGAEHPDFARALMTRADLYQNIAGYAESEKLLDRAEQIVVNAVGTRHPSYAEILRGRAGHHLALRNTAAARAALERARDVYEGVYGEGHIEVARVLHDLGQIHVHEFNFDAAESTIRKAGETARQVYGETSEPYAATVHNLGVVAHARGNLEEAERLFRQAIELQANGSAGSELPGMGLAPLAHLLTATGRTEEALGLMRQAHAQQERLIQRVFSVGSEAQRLNFLSTLENANNMFLSIVARLDTPEAAAEGLDFVLRRKALAAEALMAQRDAIVSGGDPDLEARFARLRGLHEQIARATLAGPDHSGPDLLEEKLAAWSEEAGKIEEFLAREIPEVRLERELSSADTSVVAASLPADAALVEIVRFRPLNFESAPVSADKHWFPDCYVAFVVRSVAPDEVQMITLGDATDIEPLIRDFRAAVVGDETADGEWSRYGQALRAAVFDPLANAIGDCRRLYLSPDGDLAYLPFEILPLAPGRFVIDDYTISYLTVGRDLLRFAGVSRRNKNPPLVIADPDFNLRGETGSFDEDDEADRRGISHRQSRRLLQRSGNLRFEPLPGAREEGEKVAALFGVTALLGAAATEGALKKAPSPQVLHMATHGFFLPDPEPAADEELLVQFFPGSPSAARQRRLAATENPLLRSGLALSGANTWLEGGPLPEEAEDAILNAVDVTGMDLLGTDLVVLSACETALGQVRAGEGVFGLRRAFVLAGAKTLVMSLWQVPDEETRELMIAFYKRILAGEPRVQALRQAQLAVKERHPEPYFWGAFICQGDPGPVPAA